MNEIIVPRELHDFRLLGYTIGNFGLSLNNVFVSVFVFQFYVYTINLNSIFVSIGISLNLITAAIFSIIFGVISDNKKPGKLGKRRPLLFYGLPIWILTNILLWLPPWYCPENNSMFIPTILYLWIVIIIKEIFGALILTVYSSMFPEQSQTRENREKVASVNTVFTIIASILSLMLPLIIESFLEDPGNIKWWEPSGKYILFYIPIIGIIFAIFGLIALILTFFSVNEKFYDLILEKENKKVSLRDKFQQMLKPAKDEKFRKFLAVNFNTNFSSKIMGIIVIPFLTYVLYFRASNFYIYIVVAIFAKFGWYFVWKKILKKRGLTKTFSSCIAFSVIASLLGLFFLIEIASFELKIVFFIITVGTVLGTIYGIGLFSSPVISVLVNEAAIKLEEENSDKAISELSGAYFGLSSFMASIGSAFASLMLGFILSGPNEENPIIITISFSIMGIFYLISLFYVRQIKIDEKLSDFSLIRAKNKG
jgi:Na+/melibiose symporter-like transporter